MNTTGTPTISFEDFSKLELKTGTILEAEEMEGSEKLIKLKVDIGEEAPRQILVGVKQWYKPEDFIGKQQTRCICVSRYNIHLLFGDEF